MMRPGACPTINSFAVELNWTIGRGPKGRSVQIVQDWISFNKEEVRAVFSIMSSRAIKAFTTYQLVRAACIACHLENWYAAPAQIVAFEKAAVSMARGAKQKSLEYTNLCDDKLRNCNGQSGAIVLASGHPVPDADRVVAEQVVTRAVSGTNVVDLGDMIRA
ncbi:MAG: DUF4147 domain-containing protein [Paracoccaceae bacterium]